MSTVAAMRAYLRDVIGLADTPAPAASINERRDAVRNEGLESITDFVEFDDEGIRTLCASVRKPGGTIEDPNDPDRRIANPGYSIPAICEKRIKWAAYGSRLYALIGRTVTADLLNRDRLREFERHFLVIDEHDDPENLPTISKSFGIMKALDALPVHLRERLGVNKIPLAYVIRTNSTPPPLNELEEGSITSAGYDSIIDEMIDTVPHTGPNYAEDNARVFQIIQEMVTGSSHEASIKAHRRSRNGRAAYQSLHMHNMGSSKWDRIIDDCETYLLKREWNGRNFRFTLKSHIAKHREAHNELTRASEFITYELPNEHTRVSRLLKSITSKDPAIVSSIIHINGDIDKRNDFEEAADFLLLNAPAAKELETTYRISALGLKLSGDGDKKNIGKTGVELRYYKRDEYNKLSNEQKKELQLWRKDKKTKDGNNSDSKGTKNNKSRISALETQIAELIKLNKDMTEKISAVSTSKGSITNDGDANKNPLTFSLNQRNDI